MNIIEFKQASISIIEIIIDIIDITVMNQHLKLVEITKNPGILVDTKLRFKNHVIKMIRTVHAKLKVSYCSSEYLEKKKKYGAFFTIVFSYHILITAKPFLVTDML